MNGEGIERGSRPVRQPIHINQEAQETNHGFRSQHAPKLIGRLGDDVAINHLASGGRVANMSIATDESYIDRQTGERKSIRTEWHRVRDASRTVWSTCWRSTRRRAAWSTSRASSRPGNWRKDGEDSDRFSTEILLVPGGRVQFLDKPANGNGAPAQGGEATPPAPAATGTADPDDSEIPF